MFTKTEQNKLLKIRRILEEVKTWYNGYRFGDIYVYNPWSILNYIDNKELRAYWVNTSSNVVIKEMLKNSDSRAFKTLEDLFMKKDVPVTISNNIALGKHLSPSEIWELLLFSGYLTIKDKIDEDEYIDVCAYTPQELADMIYSGKIQDSKTVAAIMAYINRK